MMSIEKTYKSINAIGKFVLIAICTQRDHSRVIEKSSSYEQCMPKAREPWIIIW